MWEDTCPLLLSDKEEIKKRIFMGSVWTLSSPLLRDTNKQWKQILDDDRHAFIPSHWKIIEFTLLPSSALKRSTWRSCWAAVTTSVRGNTAQFYRRRCWWSTSVCEDGAECCAVKEEAGCQTHSIQNIWRARDGVKAEPLDSVPEVLRY